MGEANFYYFTCLNFNYLRRWCPFEGPSNAKMGSHKTLKIKKVLAKKQNRTGRFLSGSGCEQATRFVTTPRDVTGGEPSSSFKLFLDVICTRFLLSVNGASIRFRRTSRLHLNVKLRLSLFSAPML